MRKVFLVLAGLMFLATVALLFFAGVGAFDSAPRSEAFEPHRMIGRGLLLVAVVSIAVAALARMPGRVTGLTALIAGLVVGQALIGAVAHAFDDGDQSTAVGNIVFGLHAVNGLITMAVARTVFARARQLVAPAAPIPTSVSPASP